MVAEGKKNTCDILIVDDDEFNLKVAGDILKDDFLVCTAQSGEKALECLETETPRLILLDLHMPGMDGRETMKRIRENEKWKKIPIIFLTADTKPETEKECLVLGASDFITKPFVPMVVQSRISRIMELAELQNALESRLDEKTKLVEKMSLNAIMVIANTIDAKDAYTSGHSMRVAKCSEAIARRLKWEESEIQNLHSIALLHDIGKIGVPDAILNKPTKLSNEEFEVIKKHPVIGNDILKDIHMIKNVAEGALYHHERYDGKGYPFGIAGEQIPLCARIIGIADAYDAMTSNRIYRRKLDPDKVINEFEKGRGTQFDPQLTDLFLEMLKEQADMPGGGSIFWDSSLAGADSDLLNRVLEEYSDGVQDQAAIDTLTGLYKKSYAEDKIGRLITDGHIGALLMMNMDNFKEINDTYGHIVGDKVLQIFAETLRVNARSEDILCRLGGDGFMAFLTDVFDRQQVERYVKNVSNMLGDRLKKLYDGNAGTVSFGIALYPEDGRSFGVLCDNADKSLYYVKRNGKNSYSFYSDEGPKNNANDSGTDLDQIRHMIEGRMEIEQGAFRVEYEDFRKLYHYISRGVKRNHQQVQTLLFTLGMNHSENKELQPEEAMKNLELAVASSLRMVDVGTRYSSIQYMVILLDSDLENGRKVADRVIKQFYKIFGGHNVTVTYDIQTMLPRMNKETAE